MRKERKEFCMDWIYLLTLFVLVATLLQSCDTKIKKGVEADVCKGAKATYIYEGTEYSCFDGGKI